MSETYKKINNFKAILSYVVSEARHLNNSANCKTMINGTKGTENANRKITLDQFRRYTKGKLEHYSKPKWKLWWQHIYRWIWIRICTTNYYLPNNQCSKISFRDHTSGKTKTPVRPTSSYGLLSRIYGPSSCAEKAEMRLILISIKNLRSKRKTREREAYYLK